MGSIRYRKYKPRPIKFHYCEKCGIKFRVYNFTQKYCGNVKNKIGCVWLHHLEVGREFNKKHRDWRRHYGKKYYWKNHEKMLEQINERYLRLYKRKRAKKYKPRKLVI